MLFIFSVLIYIVYFRRRILFRFNVMQVLETNHAMLNVIEMYARPERTDELMFQLLSVVLSRLKELHEINSVRLLLYRGKGEKIGTFLQGKKIMEFWQILYSVRLMKRKMLFLMKCPTLRFILCFFA